MYYQLFMDNLYIFFITSTGHTGMQVLTVVGHLPKHDLHFIYVVYRTGNIYNPNYFRIWNEISVLCKKHSYTHMAWYNLSFVAHNRFPQYQRIFHRDSSFISFIHCQMTGNSERVIGLFILVFFFFPNIILN